MLNKIKDKILFWGISIKDLLYKKGWSGINIDPNPETIKAFDIYRPKDINLNLGVALEKGNKKLTVFNHRACSTFDETQKKEISGKVYIRELRQQDTGKEKNNKTKIFNFLENKGYRLHSVIDLSSIYIWEERR